MINLKQVVQAWKKPEFKTVFKQAVAKMGSAELPLQQGLSASDYALDNDLGVMYLSASESETLIRVKAGIFYQGVIAGCNCADDPSPVETQTEYSEMLFLINKQTGQTAVELLS